MNGDSAVTSESAPMMNSYVLMLDIESAGLVMEQLIADTVEDLHPISVHFPIALLLVFAGLTVYSAVWHKDWVSSASWLLLLLGTLGAIAATVTGLVSHFAYEELEVHEVIDNHLLWSIAATAFFVLLTLWRMVTRIRGSDVGSSAPFAVLAVVGAGVLTMSGMTGGDLVFDHGINVRGINPLLEP